MLIGINEFSANATKLMRTLASSDGFVVTKHNRDILVAITPGGVRHADEIPMRRLSRNTFDVVKEVRKSGKPATITKRGEPVAEISPVSATAARKHAAAVAASSQRILAGLKQADADFAAGRAIDLDDEFIESLPKSRSRSTRQRTRKPKRST